MERPFFPQALGWPQRWPHIHHQTPIQLPLFGGKKIKAGDSTADTEAISSSRTFVPGDHNQDVGGRLLLSWEEVLSSIPSRSRVEKENTDSETGIGWPCCGDVGRTKSTDPWAPSRDGTDEEGRPVRNGVEVSDWMRLVFGASG